MIKHKVIELRSFDECSPELQKKILEKYRYIETEGGWIVDMVCDSMSDMIDREYGFKCTAKDIQYDVSYCQGSGASFTCSDDDSPFDITMHPNDYLYYQIDVAISKIIEAIEAYD